MKPRVWGTNVVLKPVEKKQEVTSGGIIIPETAQKSKMDVPHGIVESIGDGVTEVEVGNDVIYTKILSQIGDGDERRLIVSEDSLICEID